MLDSGRIFTWAWKLLPRVPSSVVQGLFDLAALAAHALRIGGVTQLEANLTRITGLEGRALRALSRRGMRRYLRYYGEAFQLPRFTPEEIAARVRAVNLPPTQQALESGAVIGALGHLGNWDLAGAWSETQLAHVITVAEKLEPPELFDQFLSFRENLGMRILAYEGGAGVFRKLLVAARTTSALMPLLADRDLSSDGVHVTVCGHPMRVAPGPAAIALHAGRPLVGVFIRHERLRGSRRRQAGSSWGIVIEFTNPIHPPVDIKKSERPRAMMQEWAHHFSTFLSHHPEDWHMLQRCFVVDLDPDRLARATAGASSETP